MGFILERKFQNYIAPKGYMVDHGKMNDDMVRNHLSRDQVMRNTLNGEYNVPIPDFLKPYHKNA